MAKSRNYEEAGKERGWGPTGIAGESAAGSAATYGGFADLCPTEKIAGQGAFLADYGATPIRPMILTDAGRPATCAKVRI